MYEQKKYINILNSLIVESDDNEFKNFLPFSIETLQHNETLCESIIDYLGDIYVCKGFDEYYCETELGKSISQVMDFLAQCNV